MSSKSTVLQSFYFSHLYVGSSNKNNAEELWFQKLLSLYVTVEIVSKQNTVLKYSPWVHFNIKLGKILFYLISEL